MATMLEEMTEAQLLSKVRRCNDAYISDSHIIVVGNNNKIDSDDVWIIGEENIILSGRENVLCLGTKAIVTYGKNYKPNIHIGNQTIITNTGSSHYVFVDENSALKCFESTDPTYKAIAKRIAKACSLARQLKADATKANNADYTWTETRTPVAQQTQLVSTVSAVTPARQMMTYTEFLAKYESQLAKFREYKDAEEKKSRKDRNKVIMEATGNVDDVVAALEDEFESMNKQYARKLAELEKKFQAVLKEQTAEIENGAAKALEEEKRQRQEKGRQRLAEAEKNATAKEAAEKDKATAEEEAAMLKEIEEEERKKRLKEKLRAKIIAGASCQIED